MDVHVPIAITRQLRKRGIDVLRAQDDVIADQHRLTIGECVLDLELIAKVYEPEEIRNVIEYIPL